MKNLWILIIMGLVVGLGIKLLAMEVFTVPTDSMEPTLLRGSKIWVNKFFYTHFSKNDIVGFEKNGENYVKRIIGMPHDTVYFDGKNYDILSQIGNGYIIPAKGESIQFNKDNINFYLPLIEKYEGVEAGNLMGNIYINGRLSNTYTFIQDYYFLQGDNKNASIDSRQWGLLPVSCLFGKIIK